MSQSTSNGAKAMQLPNDQNSTGRSFGSEELEALREALESGVLISTKGSLVTRLEKEFAESLALPHAVACSSGTAAVHTALAALDLEPGDEVITTPITDMGALTPILFQGCIPVFADVDPATCNVTPRTIAARLSERTRAVLVTHLFGNPCDMTGIMALAREHGLRVIEDCAQAYQAKHQDKLVGTFGDISCFSFQQGKHMTCGEGGMVVTGDEALARRVFLFVNKAWGYGDERPDHYFLALNYRMTEFQGGVALAQLQKLEPMVTRRLEMAERLRGLLADVPGVAVPTVAPGDRHTYWKFDVRVDPHQIEGGPVGLARALAEVQIASAPRYIQKPAFMCEIFQKKRTFGRSGYPFTLARPAALDYSKNLFPGSFEALECILVLPLNERYEEHHVDHLAAAIKRAAASLAAKGVNHG